MNEITLDEMGFCPECQTETLWVECGRCGNDVCVACHPPIGCDG